jgi:hypothetical protein
MERHVFPLPYAPFTCGLAGVAVRTTDFALCDLYENGRPSETRRAHICDVVAFITQVVELEHYRITLAAVDARMLR